MRRGDAIRFWVSLGPLYRVHRSRIERAPLRVYFEPGCVGSEIHHLASLRHRGETRRGPSRYRFVFFWRAISALDSPTFLRFPRRAARFRLALGLGNRRDADP